MAAELRIYHEARLTVNGEAWKPFGTVLDSVKGSAASIDGGNNPKGPTRIKVPAGGSVVAWQWADTNGFAYMELRPVGGAGFCYAWIRVARPVSVSDLTPNNYGPEPWQNLGKSCVGVLSLDSERAYTDTVAGKAGGDNAGVPLSLSSGTRVLGVIDKLLLVNESTADVFMDLLVAPK